MNCPAPKKPGVDVLTYTVHPRGPLDDVRKRVGSPVSQAELARCLAEHVLPVLGCRSCLDDICATSVEVQQKNIQLQVDAERLGDQVDATARELAIAQVALEEVTRKLGRVEQERDDLRQSARVARQRAADEVAASTDTARALAQALRERDSERDERVKNSEAKRATEDRAERAEADNVTLLTAIRRVLAVVDRPTTPALQDAQLRELGVALERLRAALESSEGEVRHG